MKKIMITGIAGLLGANAAFILKKDFIVVGFDTESVSMQEVQTYTFNAMQFDKLEEVIVQERPDVILHTIAVVNVDLCEEQPNMAKKVNTDLTEVLADLCQKHNCKLIYISTDSVFAGNIPSHLYTEQEIPDPINTYARTKWAAEQRVLDGGGIVLRTNIFGFNFQDKQSFGEWILNSLQKGEKITLFEDIFFSPITVNELSQIIGMVIKKDLDGLFHVCGTGSISKYHFGVFLAECFGASSGYISKGMSCLHAFKAPRPQNMSMSNQRICEALDIAIRTPQESICFFKHLYDNEYQQELRTFGGKGKEYEQY